MEGRKYRQGRDAEGLTAREREVREAMIEGLNLLQIAARLGLTKQRVHQIQKSLARKGQVIRKDGQWFVRPRPQAKGEQS